MRLGLIGEGGRLGFMGSLEADDVRHALETARSSGFRVVRLRDGETSFSAVLSEVSTVGGEDEEFEDEGVVETGPVTIEVCASAVGYVRLPEGLAVGGTVESGQVVAEIVALGIANDVASKGGGVVKEILVSQGDPVEWGQALMVLERER